MTKFKADIIKNFISKKNISTIIDYGFGDDNQLRIAKYPSLLGFNVSPKIIELFNSIFKNDPGKEFKIISNDSNETEELTLLLDVIHHFVDEEIFKNI